MNRSTATLLALVLAGAGCGPGAVPMETAQVTVTLGNPERFFVHAGTPLPLTLTLYNPGAIAVAPDAGLVDGSRLEVLDGDGARLQSAGGAAVIPPPLEPGGRARAQLDPVALFPGLSEPGHYTLTVVYPRFRSNSVPLQVIPAYDSRAEHRARVETTHGALELEFFKEDAPRHVKNFVNLARAGFYDDVKIHRVVPGQLIQTGDPTGTGRGGPGYTLNAEFNKRPHRAGTLSMARGPSPHSAGSQWFISLDRVPEWDGNYTVFGQVSEGMETARKLGRIPVASEVPMEDARVLSVRIMTLPSTS